MAKFEYMERAFSSELRPRARLVLQVLVLHCNKEGECFPSIKTIAAKCGYGISTVKRALDELVEAGYIIKQARFDERKNGGQTSNLYTLCVEAPQPPAPEQPTKPKSPMPDKEADETENDLSSMPDSTPGEQSALFLFPVYSFSHGLDKIKTGRHFNRPSFQKMIEDIEMSYVTAVIVKDMSRLGRDYLGVGYYTDTFFPEHNIRFIAVNDCVDSDDGENELAPFRNVMNEMYARDISRKVRSAHRIRGNSGEPLGQPPYGYRKDPLNKKHWIIDPEAAQVVRDIFRMCLEGKGNDTIARILQENGILNCTAYWHEKGIGRGGKKTQPNPYRWKNSTIRKILTQQEYCGDVINFKTYSKSFKDKTRIDNPEENWVIFKDVHEPIVDRDTFEQVQKKIIKRTKRRAPKSENGEKSIFSDLLYCADCGHKLWYHVNTINKNICFFSCSNYVKDYRGSCLTRHYVRADAIEQVVKLELQRMAQFLRDDEPMFADLLERKSNREIAEEKKRLEGELQKARMRTETVSRLYKKAFEKNAEGLLSDEGFLQITHEYDVEQLALKAKIPQLREQIAEAERQAANKDKFIAAIRKFMQMDELTAPLLRELIDHIEVYETQGVGKSRTQRITIHYRFVGYIDIPAAPLTSHYISETRQGVAVEYIPA